MATMERETEDRIDRLIKAERRGVWLALIVMLALAAALILTGEAQRMLLTTVVPIGIVFGVAWVSRGTGKAAAKTTAEERELVTRDESRVSAIGQAYKWAFFLMLGELAAMGFMGAVMGTDWSGQMVAVLALATGAIGFLACFLLFDRI